MEKAKTLAKAVLSLAVVFGLAYGMKRADEWFRTEVSVWKGAIAEEQIHHFLGDRSVTYDMKKRIADNADSLNETQLRGALYATFLRLDSCQAALNTINEMSMNSVTE